MKELKNDILIIGGGLTGLATAYALSSLNKKITIIDRSNLFTHGSFTDLRTTAISEGSKQFFEKIDLWRSLKKFSQPIVRIKVEDRNYKRKINFKNENNKKNLGYIVNNRDIKKTILTKLKDKRNITIIKKSNFLSLENYEEHIISIFDNYKIISKLVIAADGKNSSVKKYLKTKTFSKNYSHSASVINFNHTKNHNNTAFELFYKTGPLAILPMKKIDKHSFSSSIIWTNKKNYTNELSKIEKNLLKLILEEKVSSYVGNILKIHNIQTFPLSAHINSQFYSNRLLYIGDAAHSIHPIAGQGWNVGVRDIKNCLSILKQSEKIGLDIGSVVNCKKYNNLCYSDSYSLYQITDKLNSFFLSEDFFLSLTRHIGFKFIENNSFIKNRITNFAMGLK